MATGFTKWEETDGPVLIQSLYDGGVISEPVFGWLMAGTDETSYVDIGMLTPDSIRKDEEIVWMDVVYDDFWWTNFVTGVKIDGNEYQVPKSYAITDTGTSCIYVPTDIYKAMEEKILEDITSVDYDEEGYPYFDCKEWRNLPTLEVLFGGYWFDVSIEDYYLAHDCSLCILDAEANDWILGDAFLRGFYATHDHAKKQFGFAPHSTSKK